VSGCYRLWACDCLLQHFGRFGSPSLIRSDRRSHYANDLIKEFLDRIGTPHNLTLAYSKQENASQPLVERVNKEVNRHLRAFIFESIDLASYRTHLPFVQRIINASVHASTGASPASLLFGNTVRLDKGILLPSPEVPSTLIPASTKVAEMSVVSGTQTSFAVDSFVLVQYSSAPPTRLHTKWEGPFKVISSHLSEYTLLNLVSKRTRVVHASRLKPFVFDPTTQDPMDTARRDYMEFFVDAILGHTGDCRRVSTPTFLVHLWNGQGYHLLAMPLRCIRCCRLPYKDRKKKCWTLL
jgi:hypothetical protein